MVPHGYHHHHRHHYQHHLIYQMILLVIMDLLQMLMDHVYRQWQVFDLNKEQHIRVMAMNKQYKLEKHLAKPYNLYEIKLKLKNKLLFFFRSIQVIILILQHHRLQSRHHH